MIRLLYVKNIVFFLRRRECCMLQAATCSCFIMLVLFVVLASAIVWLTREQHCTRCSALHAKHLCVRRHYEREASTRLNVEVGRVTGVSTTYCRWNSVCRRVPAFDCRRCTSTTLLASTTPQSTDVGGRRFCADERLPPRTTSRSADDAVRPRHQRRTGSPSSLIHHRHRCLDMPLFLVPCRCCMSWPRNTWVTQ